MPESSSTRTIRLLILSGLMLRLVASFTVLRPLHPDEYHQTLEFAHYLNQGYMRDSMEVRAHLRNLSWPAFLAPVMNFSSFLAPVDLHSRLAIIKFFMALCDLGILWGMLRILVAGGLGKYSTITTAIFCWTWFLVEESTRPSIEHGAAIALWIGLGCATRSGPTYNLVAGFFLAMCGVIKYPAGISSLAAFLTVLAVRIRSRDGRSAAGLAGGAFLGVAPGGVADLVYYGRPYESLWMYAQYNVLSGLSTMEFGHQPATEYFRYFWERFGGALLTAGLPLLAAALCGLVVGMASLQPWAVATVAYLAAHILVAHKEPRFMGVALHGVLLAGICGTGMILKKRPALARPRVFALLAGTAIVGNTVALIGTLRGDLWKPRGDYFYALSQLTSETCALLTIHQPHSFTLPWDNPLAAGSHIAVGTIMDENTADAGALAGGWYAGKTPACRSGLHVLVHIRSPSAALAEGTCTDLFGLPDLAPYGRISGLILRTTGNGPGLYRCPVRILNQFNGAAAAFNMVRDIPRLGKLPALGTTAADLRVFIEGVNPTRF